MQVKERVLMPEQPPASRRSNFDEVNLGLDGALAVKEAERCLSAGTRAVKRDALSMSR